MHFPPSKPVFSAILASPSTIAHKSKLETLEIIILTRGTFVNLSFASRWMGQQKKNSTEVSIITTHRDSFLTFLYEHYYFHTELSVISLNTALHADVTCLSSQQGAIAQLA